jgi:hypothetical protein
METTLHFTTDIKLTVKQLTELARQLPKKERIRLASILVEEDFITKKERLLKIKEGLEDAQLYKEGKIQLRTLTDFLADV